MSLFEIVPRLKRNLLVQVHFDLNKINEKKPDYLKYLPVKIVEA